MTAAQLASVSKPRAMSYRSAPLSLTGQGFRQSRFSMTRRCLCASAMLRALEAAKAESATTAPAPEAAAADAQDSKPKRRARKGTSRDSTAAVKKKAVRKPAAAKPVARSTTQPPEQEPAALGIASVSGAAWSEIDHAAVRRWHTGPAAKAH